MRSFLGRFIFYALILAVIPLFVFNRDARADLSASPSNIQFYIAKEQVTNPNPVTLSVFSKTATSGPTTTIDNNNVVVHENEGCILASASDSWITVPTTCNSVTPGQPATFSVGIDLTKLPFINSTPICTTGTNAAPVCSAINTTPACLGSGTTSGTTAIYTVTSAPICSNSNTVPKCIKDSSGNIVPTCIDTNKVTKFTGTITLTDEIITTTNTDNGTRTELRPNGANPTTTVNVTVYIQSIKNSTGAMTLTTSDWLDLNLDIPITKDLSGALYVLVEHKSLAPGQTFAYRYDPTNGPQFYYFSQWGQPVNNAQLLYYAADVHNTPIAVPFTSSAADSTIPYGQTDVVSTIPIRFGAGMRLIGMEGDMIIHVLIGDPNNIQNWTSWRELLYYVLHVEPVTGTWTVTEYYQGQPYTYTNYPLFLYEKRGVLSGIWNDPHGQQQLYVSYGNPTDQVCTNSLAVQGHRFNAQACDMAGGYQIYFNEPTAFGQIEYLYKISDLNGGSLKGEYMYRMLGDTAWSMPEQFSAIRREVVIPLDPTTNSYQVNGTVNGYAVQFIVDTGASTVLLDQSIAPYIGFTNLTTDPRCQACSIKVAGGGTIQTTCCTVSNITVEGLSKDNVSVAFGTQPGPALLGMSFLNSFHISTDATDGTMTISP